MHNVNVNLIGARKRSMRACTSIIMDENVYSLRRRRPVSQKTDNPVEYLNMSSSLLNLVDAASTFFGNIINDVIEDQVCFVSIWCQWNFYNGSSSISTNMGHSDILLIKAANWTYWEQFLSYGGCCYTGEPYRHSKVSIWHRSLCKTLFGTLFTMIWRFLRIFRSIGTGETRTFTIVRSSTHSVSQTNALLNLGFSIRSNLLNRTTFDTVAYICFVLQYGTQIPLSDPERTFSSTSPFKNLDLVFHMRYSFSDI